ncbi:MAG: HlyD family secretion protein [Anaerolineales bacterium]|jgi:HlyD family secretion protein
MRTTKRFHQQVTILIVLAGGLLLAGCSGLGGNTETDTAPTEIPIVVQSDIITSEGRVVPAEDLWLSFEQPGKIAEVLVEEGDTVEVGQVLARLGDRAQLEAALSAAQLEQLSAQQALDKLYEKAALAEAAAQQAVADADKARDLAQQLVDNMEGDADPVDVDAARATVVLARKALEDAREDFEPYEKKPEDNLTRARLQAVLAATQKNYDNAVTRLNNITGTSNEYDMAVAKSNLTLAEARLADAQQEYAKLQKGPDPNDLALAESRLDNAEKQIAAAQATLDKSELVSPIDGTVVTLNGKVGESAVALQPFLHLADFSNWYVETTDLNEIDVVNIDRSQPVVVVPDALPDLELTGEVERISEGYTEVAGDVVYTVRIHLLDSDPELRWGMTTSVEFPRK